MALKVVGQVSVISLQFKWDIENFCINCRKVGDRLESPRFSVNHANNGCIQWYLQLYPKGKKEAYKDYLSLYLHASAEIKAAVNLKILNNQGEAVVVETLEERVFDKDGWGNPAFVMRNFVISPINDVLNDDKMTIVCEITYAGSDMKVCKVEDTKVEVKEDANDDNEVLLNDSKFSDVTLVSEGKIVKAHKCILASRSLVFDAMFDSDAIKKLKNTVEITDVKYDVLVEMIRYIYAKKVNNISLIAGELAIAAEKYALDGLKNVCEQTMIKNLSLDNVVECLQIADKISVNKLKARAIEYIVENANYMTGKPKFNLMFDDAVRKAFCCVSRKIKK